MAKYKKSFVYSETNYAKNILDNGFPNGELHYGDMYILAKYLHQVEKCGETKLEKRLISFALSQSKDFNPISEADVIKKWVKHGMKYSLRESGTVIITQAEMGVIKSIKDLKNRKIVFAMLVFAKASKQGRIVINHSGIINDKYFINFSRFPAIIKLLDFRITEPQLVNKLGEIYDLKVITIYSPEKELVRVDFANDNSPMALTIKQIDCSLEYYKTYFGGVSGYCADCGAEIVKKSNAQVRCDSCSKLKKKEDNKIIKRIARNVTN